MKRGLGYPTTHLRRDLWGPPVRQAQGRLPHPRREFTPLAHRIMGSLLAEPHGCEGLGGGGLFGVGLAGAGASSHGRAVYQHIGGELAGVVLA